MEQRDDHDWAMLLAGTEQLDSTIHEINENHLGVLDTKFLCQSISILQSEPAIQVNEEAPLNEVLLILKDRGIGCVLVVDQNNRLTGIFGERDFMKKVYGNNLNLEKALVREYMTPNPMTATPDTHIAYALTMMSNLGFRHIPIVDQDNIPIAVVSVRDIVNYLVKSLTEDLLNLEATENS